MIEILLVEDDEYIRDSMAVFFSYDKYNLTVAETAEEGSALIINNSFDVIIADNVLPGMSGIEFLQVVQGQNAVKILISGHVSRDLIEEAQEYGVVECFEKPFDVAYFEKQILGLLKKRRG